MSMKDQINYDIRNLKPIFDETYQIADSAEFYWIVWNVMEFCKWYTKMQWYVKVSENNIQGA